MVFTKMRLRLNQSFLSLNLYRLFARSRNVTLSLNAYLSFIQKP